jgi:septal ring factor EnvC (AmiA/AmiB activator)
MQDPHFSTRKSWHTPNMKDNINQEGRVVLFPSPYPRKTSWVLKPACILFVVFGVLLILSLTDVFSGQSKEIGIITASKLNVRSEPGLDEPAIKVLNKDTQVEITKHVEGWLEIIHNGQIGYVRDRESYVRIIKAPEIEPDQSDIERFKQKAEDIGRQLEKSKTEVLAFTKKEMNTINSLNKIDMALDTTQKRVSSLKSERVELNKEIEETTHLSNDLIEKINTTEKYASTRLVALYKLNWLGRLHILASAESIHDLFLRKTTLERILAQDESIRKNLVEDRARLEKLLKRQNVIKKEKQSLEIAYNEQIRIMRIEKEKRSKLLDDIRSKRSLELAAIESLKQAALKLDQTIKSLNLEYNQAGPVAKPTGDKGQKSFTALKGLLKIPVKGKIISFYGPYKNTKFNVVNFRSGINIKADRGEPIRSVFAGKTLYSSWFKGYGNMIIIDHGNNYYTVYGHVEELFKKKGDRVETGEVIATVGDTGSIYGSRLYFEVRHHGKPMDPLLWIKEG